MHRRIPLFMLLAAAAALAQDAPKTAVMPKARKVEIIYETTIADIPAGSKMLRVWVPQPREEKGIQEVISATIGTDKASMRAGVKETGENRYWVLEIDDPPKSVTFKATLQVKRTEQINNKFAGAGAKALSAEDRETLKDALVANAKVPTSGEIEKIADKVVPVGETNTIKLARQIYDHVLSTMEYKKTGTGWGQGDTMWACENKYGNCTDFHSVFMSLGRIRGIPVRFTMGLPIPPEKSGTIGGYHCWAEFFVADLGWVPVDISEAAKKKADKALGEYYFGSLTADRVAFTRGRDLVLDPAPASGKQNFFIYPIVEVDGKAHPEKHVFTYKDLE
jgi:transglutaminase-like putative cysteine protease